LLYNRCQVELRDLINRRKTEDPKLKREADKAEVEARSTENSVAMMKASLASAAADARDDLIKNMQAHLQASKAAFDMAKSKYEVLITKNKEKAGGGTFCRVSTVLGNSLTVLTAITGSSCPRASSSSSGSK